MTRPVVLSLPFEGLWVVQNSPARRVPSHGVDIFGERFAIDFVAVDRLGRTGRSRDWRTVLAAEPPDRFFGFGRPVLAPADGVVVDVHDGEFDHAGRRSQLSLIPYMLGQAKRLRQGVHAVAGNSLTIALSDGSGFAALAHLQRESMRVAVGDAVRAGEEIAKCGNSGNSTEPHLHMQVMDSADFSIARGVPLAFRNFRERSRGGPEFVVRSVGVPAEGAIVESLAT
ncbi:M23 family metallopeptidase [Agromyces subbeticus]|uniref:M23 family metallopeptidase n=1 Tax=Agromyces subbeticus TaxID=293890 RepID=UPI000A02B729|nr:M23 family metallopeptidase [Agromyces subbeticus]